MPPIIQIALALLVVGLMLYISTKKINKKEFSFFNNDKEELRSIIRTMVSAFHSADIKVPNTIYRRYVDEGPHKVASIVPVPLGKPYDQTQYEVFLDVGSASTAVSVITGRFVKEDIENYLRHAGFQFK